MRHEYRVGRDGRVTRLDHDQVRTDTRRLERAWADGQSGVLHGWRAVVAHLASSSQGFAHLAA